MKYIKWVAYILILLLFGFSFAHIEFPYRKEIFYTLIIYVVFEKTYQYFKSKSV